MNKLLTSADINRLHKTRKIHLGFQDNTAKNGISALCMNKRFRLVVDADEAERVTCKECQQILLQKTACWGEDEKSA